LRFRNPNAEKYKSTQNQDFQKLRQTLWDGCEFISQIVTRLRTGHTMAIYRSHAAD